MKKWQGIFDFYQYGFGITFLSNLQDGIKDKKKLKHFLSRGKLILVNGIGNRNKKKKWFFGLDTTNLIIKF